MFHLPPPRPSSPNQLLGQTRKHRTNHRHHTTNGNQTPIHNLLSASNILAKEFQMKHERQNNANRETRHTPQQRHDAIETRKRDSYHYKRCNCADAQADFEYTPREARHALQRRCSR